MMKSSKQKQHILILGVTLFKEAIDLGNSKPDILAFSRFLQPLADRMNVRLWETNIAPPHILYEDTDTGDEIRVDL
jgi:hypothetical protein